MRLRVDGRTDGNSWPLRPGDRSIFDVIPGATDGGEPGIHTLGCTNGLHKLAALGPPGNDYFGPIKNSLSVRSRTR